MLRIVNKYIIIEYKKNVKYKKKRALIRAKVKLKKT